MSFAMADPHGAGNTGASSKSLVTPTGVRVACQRLVARLEGLVVYGR